MSLSDSIKEAKQFGDTIVLIAAKHVSAQTRDELHHEAMQHHEGPIFMFPHDWQAIGLDELQKMIDEARRHEQKRPARPCKFCGSNDDKSGCSNCDPE